MLTLDLAIVTYKPEGIKRVEGLILPPMDNVRYIVSWQEHENASIPESLQKREDVEIHRFNEKGVSNNRNNALKFCRADLVMIADDDMVYQPEAIFKLMKEYEENPEVDMMLTRVIFPEKKTYPQNGTRICLPFPKGYSGCNVEISFRKEKIKDLIYWSGIGPGNDTLQCGEDELFLIAAVKRGYNVQHRDIIIGEHPGISTGQRVNEGILRGQGFIISVFYPYSWILRVPLKAYRVSKKANVSFLKSLGHLAKGAVIAKLKFSKVPKECRW